MRVLKANELRNVAGGATQARGDLDEYGTPPEIVRCFFWLWSPAACNAVLPRRAEPPSPRAGANA